MLAASSFDVGQFIGRVVVGLVVVGLVVTFTRRDLTWRQKLVGGHSNPAAPVEVASAEAPAPWWEQHRRTLTVVAVVAVVAGSFALTFGGTEEDDRAEFVAGCRDGAAGSGVQVSAEGVDAYCGCLADRVLPQFTAAEFEALMATGPAALEDERVAEMLDACVPLLDAPSSQ